MESEMIYDDDEYTYGDDDNDPVYEEKEYPSEHPFGYTEYVYEDNYIPRVGYGAINSPQYEPSGIKTLGEIFTKCKEFPKDSVLIVVVYDLDKKAFWCPDELIIELTICNEERSIVAYSGYYTDRPKARVITNGQFLYSCDPDNTGSVNRMHYSKDDASEWLINNETPIFISTKEYGDHQINDAIFFESRGTKYIGLVLNA